MDRQFRNDNGDYGRNMADLTLKLGLSYLYDNDNYNNNNNNQSYDVPAATNHLSNFHFIYPNSNQKSGSHGRMTNAGSQKSTMVNNIATRNAVNFGMVNNMNPLAWQPQQMPDHYNDYMTNYHPLYNINNSNNNNNGSVVGFPVMTQYPNFNFDDQSSGSFATSSSSTPVSRRLQSSGSYNDPSKRCTNCNPYDTPMWRKGPLGPKSLCNACGIKYRKEAERRRAQEVERSLNN